MVARNLILEVDSYCSNSDLIVMMVFPFPTIQEEGLPFLKLEELVDSVDRKEPERVEQGHKNVVSVQQVDILLQHAD
jgi:hypothetical protein